MYQHKFISGRRNCHIKGLYSYVIRDRINHDQGMLRIFHQTGDCMSQLYSREHYTFAPHNHRQDITLWHLFGEVVNVDFTVRKSQEHGKTDLEYEFRSALLGQGAVAMWKDTCRLVLTQIRPMTGIRLPAQAVHTVIAQPGSAWLVVEGSTTDKPPLCYTNGDKFELSTDGLYVSCTPEELTLAASIMPWDRIDQILYNTAGI